MSKAVPASPAPSAPRPATTAVRDRSNGAATTARERLSKRSNGAAATARQRLADGSTGAAATARHAIDAAAAEILAGTGEAARALRQPDLTAVTDLFAAFDAAAIDALSPLDGLVMTPAGRSSIAGVAASRSGGPAATAPAEALRSPAVLARPAPHASGWRHAATNTVGSVRAAAAGLTAPAGGPSNGAASAAVDSAAGAAATALLGILAFFAFTSLRNGARVRLRSAWAPASPFLSLLERPG